MAEQMREFASLGLVYMPEDGKKHFKCECVRLSSIVNTKIEIHDFETDIPTENGPRTLIYFKEFGSGESGVYKKFFTSSKEMTFLLGEARERDMLPFSTVIRSEFYDGGKIHYKFT